MSEYPNLKGVVTKDLVEKVDAGKYKADYINWSRTMQVLRDHAPGWLPELVQTAEGGYVHRGGVGGFLLIRFVHEDGTATPGFPQAIMDNRNQAIPVDKITARDITDTHRRGACMAAAFAFGLGYELWAKMPLESGYADPAPGQSTAKGSEPSREREPGAALSKAQLDTIEALVAVLASLRDVDAQSVVQALEHDNGPLDKLTEQAATELLKKMQRWEKNLRAAQGSGEAGPPSGKSGQSAPMSAPSAASPDQTSAGEEPAGDGASVPEAADAPAEPLFKAPTGPRGSKRKAAA